MSKFIVDVVHDFGSSLRPDVGRGFLHVSSVFLFLTKAFGMAAIKNPEFYSTNKMNSESLRSN